MAKSTGKTYTVRSFIQGLRDGKPWPAVGEPIDLDEAEARDYLALGYIVEHEPTEADLELVGEVPRPPRPDVVDGDAGLSQVHGGLVPGNADIEPEPGAEPRQPRIRR